VAIPADSVVVGQCYLTPEEEAREVVSIVDGVVHYRAVMDTGGPGILARPTEKKLPLDVFAKEADVAVSPQ
jgi:hypothetical protein